MRNELTSEWADNDAHKMALKAPVFLLASMLTAYPPADFIDQVQDLLNAPPLALGEANEAALLWNSLRPHLMAMLDPEVLDELRSTYIDLFDRNGSANPLYETAYGRGQSFGKVQELADLSGFYRAFGLEFGGDDTAHDMMDHVAVELEFYGLLLAKQALLEERGDALGTEIVQDARAKFLQDHLGRFVSSISLSPVVSTHPYFSLVFQWCRALVDAEVRMLEVSPVPADAVFELPDLDDMECGGLKNSEISPAFGC